MILIQTLEPRLDGTLFVVAAVENDQGTHIGPWILDLPEDASEADIIAAIAVIEAE
jgi:hypothetical protein